MNDKSYIVQKMFNQIAKNYDFAEICITSGSELILDNNIDAMNNFGINLKYNF